MLKELTQNVCDSIFNRTGIKAFPSDAFKKSEFVFKKMNDKNPFVVVSTAIIPSYFNEDDTTLTYTSEGNLTYFDIDTIPVEIEIDITAYANDIDIVDNAAKTIRKTLEAGLNTGIDNTLGEPCEIKFIDERKVPKEGPDGLYSIELLITQSKVIPNLELLYREPSESVLFTDHFELNELLAMYYYYMHLLDQGSQGNTEVIKRRADTIADCLGIEQNEQDESGFFPRSLKAATSYLNTIVSNPNATMVDVINNYR